jgi:hypothetical protein
MRIKQAINEYLNTHPEQDLVDKLLTAKDLKTVNQIQAEIKAIRKVCGEIMAIINTLKPDQGVVEAKEEQAKKQSLDIQRMLDVENKANNINL